MSAGGFYKCGKNKWEKTSGNQESKSTESQESKSRGDPKGNMSSYELNDIEKKVLSCGLKFCIQPDKLDYCQSLTPFEKIIRSLKTNL